MRLTQRQTDGGQRALWAVRALARTGADTSALETLLDALEALGVEEALPGAYSRTVDSVDRAILAGAPRGPEEEK